MADSAKRTIKSFATEATFEKWLAKNHRTSTGLWVRFFKKASGKKGLVYKGALDVALSYGWIDSQVKKYDDASYIHRFTPRGPKSIWSKVNREHVARLVKEKRMQPGGLAEVASAKKDGRWDRAYDSPSKMEMPSDFLKLVNTDKKAKAFFNSLNRANLYAIAWRLQTAKKTETRAKRMQAIFLMLKKDQKFH